MNEQEIRRIARDEILKNFNSGTPRVPPHNHNESDNLRISQSDIIPATVYDGTINMSQGTIAGSYPTQTITWASYLIPAPSAINSVTFYGGALNTAAATPLHAMIVGQARLTSGYQYQPGTSNSVVAGTIKESITQGSAAIIMSNAGTSIIRNSQSYIAFASDSSNNIYAVARIYSYSNSQLVVQTAFATNWSLSGLWIVE